MLLSFVWFRLGLIGFVGFDWGDREFFFFIIRVYKDRLEDRLGDRLGGRLGVRLGDQK